MEGILLDTMFDLPSLEGVEEVDLQGSCVGHRRFTSTLLAPATPARARRRASLVLGIL
jgi:ATP-dependent protease Clp ATPase subunit